MGRCHSFLILYLMPSLPLDDKGTGSYYKPDVKIGDKYFKGTDYLVLANEKTLIARKKQMQREIKEVG